MRVQDGGEGVYAAIGLRDRDWGCRREGMRAET